MTDLYIDGSRYQSHAGGDPDFGAIKRAGVSGVVWNVQDPGYQRRIQEAHAAGLTCASYRFYNAGESVLAIADDLVAQARASGVPQAFLAPDFEMGSGDLTDSVLACLQRVQASGLAPAWLYSGNWWISAHIRADATALASYPLWDAVYNGEQWCAAPRPWTAVTMHQFTSTAQVPGIDGDVDESWLLAAGASVRPPTPTPAPVEAPTMTPQEIAAAVKLAYAQIGAPWADITDPKGFGDQVSAVEQGRSDLHNVVNAILASKTPPPAR